jgi:hypothetical protein
MPRPTDKQLSNAIRLLEQQADQAPFLWHDTVRVVVEWMRRMHGSTGSKLADDAVALIKAHALNELTVKPKSGDSTDKLLLIAEIERLRTIIHAAALPED